MTTLIPQDVDHHPLYLPREAEKKKLRKVMILTGSMMIAELVGGILTHSLALLSDGFHMLTHLLAIGVSFLAILIALRDAPIEKTFKFWRTEVLAALFNGMALLPIVGYVMYAAYIRFKSPQEIDVIPMIIVALLGLAVNLASVYLLHGSSKEDINVRGAFLHMVADSMSSIGVIGAGIVIYFTGWNIVDPIVAMGISIVILVWCLGLTRDSVNVLLESAPEHIKIDDVRSLFLTIKGLADVHDLHIWTITSGMHALTAHLIFDNDISISRANDVCRSVSRQLKEKFDITHTSLQFECKGDPGID